MDVENFQLPRKADIVFLSQNGFIYIGIHIYTKISVGVDYI